VNDAPLQLTIDPVQLLKDEHRVIEKVLHALEWMVEQHRFDEGVFLMALDFLKTFADACHHAKEEVVLFPYLQPDARTVPGGQIGSLLEEHQRGRKLIQRMQAKMDGAVRGDKGAESAILAAAGEYISLLRKHICFEDNLVFTEAAARMTPNDRAKMLADYEKAETERGVRGQCDRYIAMADQIWVRVGAMIPHPLGALRRS